MLRSVFDHSKGLSRGEQKMSVYTYAMMPKSSQHFGLTLLLPWCQQTSPTDPLYGAAFASANLCSFLGTWLSRQAEYVVGRVLSLSLWLNLLGVRSPYQTFIPGTCSQ